MRVEFAFDNHAVEQHGYTMDTVYNTIKKNFKTKGLRCVSDQEILAFEDNGNQNDFTNMWAIITQLINSSWFLTFAKMCQWYDSDEDEAEDVLSQAWKLDKRRVV